jgi:hypothetical protein
VAAFGFDPRGTDVPLAIRLGQGVRGARMGRCVVRLEKEWDTKGKPKAGGDRCFL